MGALQNHTPEQRRLYRRIVGAIAIPAAFAALAVEGEFVALAYGAIHDRLLCYESVVTNPRRQRRGYARRVVTSLAAWAKDQGAEGACLEVEAHNTGALALYDAGRAENRALPLSLSARTYDWRLGCDKNVRLAVG